MRHWEESPQRRQSTQRQGKMALLIYCLTLGCGLESAAQSDGTRSFISRMSLLAECSVIYRVLGP
jgi:hypothetical protein